MDNSDRSSEYSYTLEMQPRFPRNIFLFQEYNGIKVLSISILIVAVIYFIVSFFGLLSNNHQSYSNIGIPGYPNIFRACFSSLMHIFQSTLEIFNLLIIALPVILSFFFVWIIFDPRNVAMYILSFTNILFGFIEILNPADMIPDFIPIIGSFDDAVGGGLVAYGAVLLLQASKNREKIETVIQLMGEQNEERALQILLADRGISIRRNSDN